jgi:Flp pilus assembly protein protease CpaA
MNWVHEQDFFSLCFCAFALAFSLGAAYFDLKTRKIPNKYNATVFGLALLAKTGFAFFQIHYFTEGLLGALIGFCILFPFFVLRFVGAGDIKLLAVLGLILGWKGFLWVFALSHLLDGLLVMPFNWMRTLYLIWRLPFSWEDKMANILSHIKDLKRKIPYALPVALGCLAYLILVLCQPEWITSIEAHFQKAFMRH